ncbi:MAG: hypothetical protein P6H82_00480 [Candidatus Arsenophonus melophagi]|nr:hypothetical protein [Candidatus Arsenophonus melophagi]
MHIKYIYNTCPLLACTNTLRISAAQRIDLDLDVCINNLAILQQHYEVRDKVIQLFTDKQMVHVDTDVDTMLYSGFFLQKKDRSK